MVGVIRSPKGSERERGSRGREREGEEKRKGAGMDTAQRLPSRGRADPHMKDLADNYSLNTKFIKASLGIPRTIPCGTVPPTDASWDGA